MLFKINEPEEGGGGGAWNLRPLQERLKLIGQVVVKSIVSVGISNFKGGSQPGVVGGLGQVLGKAGNSVVLILDKILRKLLKLFLQELRVIALDRLG